MSVLPPPHPHFAHPPCLSNWIWVGASIETHTAPRRRFINNGTPQLGTDPQQGAVCISGSRKLIMAINSEHQQSAPGSEAHKLLIQDQAEHRQRRSSPPAASPSPWQLNKNQCKLLIGSLIIDAVFTTIQGVRAEKRQGWNSVCSNMVRTQCQNSQSLKHKLMLQNKRLTSLIMQKYSSRVN